MTNIFQNPVRDTASWLRWARLSHQLFGGLMNVPTGQISIQNQNNYQHTTYAEPSVFGPKTRTLHSEGTEEVSWSMNGDLTEGSLKLLFLLDPAARGLGFERLDFQQGTEGYRITAIKNYDIMWDSVSFSAAAGAPITFNLSGKTLQKPVPIVGSNELNSLDPTIPVPSWISGNDLVTDWSLSHTVGMNPVWLNGNSRLPAYYRLGESAWQLSISTSRALLRHTQIRFQSYNGIRLWQGIVDQTSIISADKKRGYTYQVQMSNSLFSTSNSTAPGAVTVDVPIILENVRNV